MSVNSIATPPPELASDAEIFSNAVIPWSVEDATASAAVIGVGLIALGGCWYGISGEPSFFNQYPWLAGAIGSTAFAYLGLVRWLLPSFRRVRRFQRAVVADMRALGLIGEIAPAAVLAVISLELPVDGGPSYSTPKMTRVHHRSCQLLEGKDGVAALTAKQIADRGLVACAVCAP